MLKLILKCLSILYLPQLILATLMLLPISLFGFVDDIKHLWVTLSLISFGLSAYICIILMAESWIPQYAKEQGALVKEKARRAKALEDALGIPDPKRF